MPHFSSVVDLAPTFLSLAGLPKPPAMDGRSLLPLLLHGEAGTDPLVLSCNVSLVDMSLLRHVTLVHL